MSPILAATLRRATAHLVSGLENYTAINQHLVEFVSSPELVTTLNAQTTSLATIQTLSVVHSVRPHHRL